MIEIGSFNIFIISFHLSLAFELIYRYYGNDRNNKIDDYLSDIAFFNGKCHSCKMCKNEIECPMDFVEITSKVNDNLFNYSKSNVYFVILLNCF